MSFDFNLNGLSTAYNEAIQREDFTFAFEIKIQKGHFIFLCFFLIKIKNLEINYFFISKTLTV